MKATFLINQLTFELDAKEARDLFQQVAQIQEIFEAETKCGCCQSESIRYSYREAGEGFKFYELLCRDCGAQFRFGQRKQTLELFPKRKDDSGKDLANHGWSKWEPRDEHDSRPPSGQQASRPGAARPPANGKPTPIAKYANWDEAEQDRQHFGRGPLDVDGALYVINPRTRAYEPYQAGR